MHRHAIDPATGTLSPGEEILEAAGVQALTWFAQGVADKPLILFVPGVRHLARISYGAHDGAEPRHFLAHHLIDLGYSFAGVSYPTDPEDGGIPDSFPGFTVRDWGRMVADVAGQLVERHGLKREVWVMCWSMSGKIAQSVHVAMREAGLRMPGIIAYTSTGPLPGLQGVGRDFGMAHNGYAASPGDRASGFAKVALSNALEGQEVIPEEAYRRRYVGNTPAALQGGGMIYRDGAFVSDQQAVIEDRGGMAFNDMPLTGAIWMSQDNRHSLTDRAVWNVYNTFTVWHRYLAAHGLNMMDMEQPARDRLNALIGDLQNRLSRGVEGHHYSLVGQTGASAIAAAADELIAEVTAVDRDLREILGLG
ncbi:hypothetical protein LR948_01905 [Roseivivax sp. GX 12232]|uniref:hypothetical protein n=1 Tax=Roseivivax sp. GX 12232 TaxID=2900547 RepID=UPI001E58A84E|nr:hypothetical protein [Roseivivax sp. GX 12232]MCE0504101.1 hypothetical protein [Roseivivax sp. GX 12232]